MVELSRDKLRFTFPEVHPQAELRVEFQRTLRIPDDGKTYPLPPGLGVFPLRHVDDFARRVPPAWSRHGGVMLPMYQSEALWIRFASARVPDHGTDYPFAVKVAAGKIDAVTGKAWSNEMHRGPQDYMVAPRQPWLDGFAVEKGVIRQFVAMPLGGGYTAEEQITGVAEHGGLQLIVRPMRREAFERRFPRRLEGRILGLPRGVMMDMETAAMRPMRAQAEMGLAPGGKMRQEIYEDLFSFDEWDQSVQSRCFVHLTNSLVWEAITDSKPPTPPPTARSYTERGLPWFDYYGEGQTLEGSETLERLRSVLEIAASKGEPALPENDSVAVDRVIHLGEKRRGAEVRDGGF